MDVKTVIKKIVFKHGVLHVTAEIDNGYVQDEITWEYTPENPVRGTPELVCSNTPMSNTTGYLLNALIAGLYPNLREEVVTCEELEEFEDSLV